MVVVAAMAASTSCAGSIAAKKPGGVAPSTVTSARSSTPSSVVDDDEAPDPAAAGAIPPAAAAGLAASSGGSCRPGDPLANVYHSYRLQIVEPCLTVTGIVVAVRAEPDGDVHVNVRLDPPYAALINARNVAGEGDALVTEIVPADEGGCTPGQPPRASSGTYNYGICTGADETAPNVGAHVSVTGPYVLDADHGWMEIHPVWSIGPVGAPSSAPPATRTPASAPGAPPAPGVTITSAPTSVAAGATASLTARTTSAATCSLTVTLPSGAQSQSSGLGNKTADGAGNIGWTWIIGSRTKPGTATAHVSCPGGSATVEFQIT
jgi:hypothetical protein